MENDVNSTSTKDQYNIIGGMLGDKDKRTRHGLRIMLATFLGVLLLLTGLGSYIYQLGNYNYYLVNNTTPIGSSSVANTNVAYAESKPADKANQFNTKMQGIVLWLKSKLLHPNLRIRNVKYGT